MKDAKREALRVSARGQSVYFGVGAQDRRAAVQEASRKRGYCVPPRRTRGCSETVTDLPGLWLDVDFATGAHKKKGLPGELDAWRFLDGLPLAPTLLVETGGGLHAYWLFREPWELGGPTERNLAERTSHGWNSYAIERAGFPVDSTWDLARVLRPVGTVNHKYGTVVRTVRHGGQRYNPSDFEEWVVPPGQSAAESDSPATRRRPPAPESPEAYLRRKREENRRGCPVSREFARALVAEYLGANPVFSAVWNAQPGTKYPSHSEIDMAVANVAVAGGLNVGEVEGVLLERAERIPGRLRKKGRRYFRRTAEKAIEGGARR